MTDKPDSAKKPQKGQLQRDSLKHLGDKNDEWRETFVFVKPKEEPDDAEKEGTENNSDS